MEDNRLILDFIKKQKLAVFSTVSPQNIPQSAVLGFGQTNDLEIIIDMFKTSRKYKNLQANPNVSLVIEWDDNITVQYEGIAQELIGDKATKYKNVYWKKNPKAKRWEKEKGITYFKITPKWIRYSDLRKHPWEIKEITL